MFLLPPLLSRKQLQEPMPQSSADIMEVSIPQRVALHALSRDQLEKPPPLLLPERPQEPLPGPVMSMHKLPPLVSLLQWPQPLLLQSKMRILEPVPIMDMPTPINAL